MNLQELIQLLKEYQNTSPETDEANQIKTKIISHFSSSYWWNSKYILKLFSEDVQQIKTELQHEIADNFELYINRKYPAAELAESLLNEALLLQEKYQKQLFTDKFINTLAIQVQTTPAHSFYRKQAIECLITAMNIKNTYKKQGLGTKLNLSPQDYEEAFQEAKGESIRYVLDNIDGYDENKGDFMGLVNYWISIKFLDAAGRILGMKKSQSKKQEEDKIFISTEDPNLMREYLYANIDEEFACNQKSEEIKHIIQQDPNNKLSKPIRKDRTDITFKDILIAVHWEGETFKNLSHRWGIPYTTIKSFYDREFKQVKADLAQYLQ